MFDIVMWTTMQFLFQQAPRLQLQFAVYPSFLNSSRKCSLPDFFKNVDVDDQLLFQPSCDFKINEVRSSRESLGELGLGGKNALMVAVLITSNVHFFR